MSEEAREKRKAKWKKLLQHPAHEELDERIREREKITPIVKDMARRFPDFILSYEYLRNYRDKIYPEQIREKSETYHRVKDTTDMQNIDIGTRLMKLQGMERPPPMKPKMFSDKQLLKFLDHDNGFREFCETLTVERGMRVKLQDYQNEMHRIMRDNDRVCIVAGGQVGKDFQLQEEILYYAICNANSLQAVVCATQPQALALRDRILLCLKASTDLYNAYESDIMKPEPCIFFANGSRALFLTAKSLIAGHTAIDRVYVNEARDIRENEVTRISPLLGVGGGKLFVLSRPRFKRGYLWDCFSNPYFKTMQLPTRINKYFETDVLEADRATLSPELFKIEYLAQFAEVGSAYFSEQALDNASQREYVFDNMVPEKGYEYGLGIDPARLRDTCAMIVIGNKIDGKPDKNGFLMKVAHIHGFSPELHDASWNSQVVYIKQLYNKFNLKYIVCEYVGMGIPYTERLQEEFRDAGLPDIVIPYENSSLKAKITLYEQAKYVTDNEDCQIPRGASRLLNELKLTALGATLRGNIKIETPVTDDYADAFCLSLWAFRRPFNWSVVSVKSEREKWFNMEVDEEKTDYLLKLVNL